MLVIPARNERKLSLLELLNKKAKEDNLSYRLHPCHRIDRDASGIVVFAKGKKSQALVMEQFKKRQVSKSYLAFIKGTLERKKGTLIDFIQAIPKKSKRRALLHYKVVEERNGWSLVNVQSLTGRTNQIRIQFANVGHPLLGERLYAFGRDFNVKFRRLGLHARGISFRHPKDRRTISLHCPLPSDMKKFLDSHD
ncbi:MAG: RNA pseudouridine synthase [Candidatus Omnitrophica bacterium]|nr:RNA pseudouridine synthase [Candidatus Omnitrophota bacterium]